MQSSVEQTGFVVFDTGVADGDVDEVVLVLLLPASEELLDGVDDEFVLVLLLPAGEELLDGVDDEVVLVLLLPAGEELLDGVDDVGPADPVPGRVAVVFALFGGSPELGVYDTTEPEFEEVELPDTDPGRV